MNQIEYFHNAKFGYMAELSFNGNWLKNGYCSITETPQKLAKKKKHISMRSSTKHMDSIISVQYSCLLLNSRKISQ